MSPCTRWGDAPPSAVAQAGRVVARAPMAGHEAHIGYGERRGHGADRGQLAQDACDEVAGDLADMAFAAFVIARRFARRVDQAKMNMHAIAHGVGRRDWRKARPPALARRDIADHLAHDHAPIRGGHAHGRTDGDFVLRFAVFELEGLGITARSPQCGHGEAAEVGLQVQRFEREVRAQIAVREVEFLLERRLDLEAGLALEFVEAALQEVAQAALPRLAVERQRVGEIENAAAARLPTDRRAPRPRDRRSVGYRRSRPRDWVRPVRGRVSAPGRPAASRSP